jgi:alpha-glucosidase
MRWDATRHAGFTSGEPWLPLGEGVEERNVARLASDGRSLLSLYRQLIRVRRSEPALQGGDQVPVRSRNDILTYKRCSGREEILVALNTIHQPRKLEWRGSGQVLLSTYLDGQKRITAPVLLRPDEGIIVKLDDGRVGR